MDEKLRELKRYIDTKIENIDEKLKPPFSEATLSEHLDYSLLENQRTAYTNVLRVLTDLYPQLKQETEESVTKD